MTPDRQLPLSAITVLDLTIARAGPTAVRLLADWGARVIRIEPPASLERGSVTGRRQGPDEQNLHRNKLSLCLDLKSPAGADISEFEDRRASAEQKKSYGEIASRGRAGMSGSSKPLIAMIQGFCIGGGLAIALNADEALRIGLINYVVEEAELEAWVREYAARVAGNAPMTLHVAKAAIRVFERYSIDSGSAEVTALVNQCFDSEDYKERRRAFMEKRKPQFQGR